MAGADQEESEVEITVYSNLGERLLAGVQNLWSAVGQLTNKAENHEKVIQHLIGQLEEMRRDIEAFRGEIRGLKISRGMARARVEKLERVARDAAGQLEHTRQRLVTMH